MTISDTKGLGWTVSVLCERGGGLANSDILTSTLAAFLFISHPKKGRHRAVHLNYYASAYNRGDNYRITRLKLNQHELNKHAFLTKYTVNVNIIKTKPWFGRLLYDLRPGNGVGLYSGG